MVNISKSDAICGLYALQTYLKDNPPRNEEEESYFKAELKGLNDVLEELDYYLRHVREDE